MPRWLGVCVLLVRSFPGLTAFQRAFQRAPYPMSHACSLYLEASRKKTQITDKFLDGIFLGTKEGSEEFFVGTAAGCVVCNTVKRRPRGDAANEPREPREPREQPLRIDVRRVHPDLPPPIGTEPARPRRVYIRNSVELARYGYTPGFIGCEAAFA